MTTKSTSDAATDGKSSKAPSTAVSARRAKRAKLAQKPRAIWFRVTRVANVEDALTGDAFEEFRFRKVTGKYGRVRVERDKAQNSRTLYRTLIKKNAALPLKGKPLSYLKEILKQEPRLFKRHVARYGWVGKGDLFVVGDRIIGQQTDRQQIIPPIWANERQIRPLKPRGSLEAWKKSVASPIGKSHVGKFATAAAFAAPILRFRGWPNFGFNLHGDSKSGKSTTLLVAGSIIGFGRERDLPNFNTTVNAALESARCLRDLVFPINEMSLLPGAGRDAYTPCREMIFSLAEGRDRARLSSSTAASAIATATFRGIFLFSSEHSIDEYAKAAKQTRSGGEYARCLDVPATGKGFKTIFDRYPESLDATQRDEWARNELESVRLGCEANRGAPLAPFIEYVIENRAFVRGWMRDLEAEFLSHIKMADLSEAFVHAAKNCAIVYAGGCIAIKAGILPWSPVSLRRSIRICFRRATRAFLRSATVARSINKQLKAVLKTRIGEGAIVDVQQAKHSDPSNVPGFFKHESGSALFTIHTKAFVSWLGGRGDAARALVWLHKGGYLVMGKATGSPSNTTTGWAACSPRWPIGKKRPAFVFRDAFDLIPPQISAGADAEPSQQTGDGEGRARTGRR